MILGELLLCPKKYCSGISITWRSILPTSSKTFFHFFADKCDKLFSLGIFFLNIAGRMLTKLHLIVKYN
uniref:Uncharacterized protein n=1 Tax=Heterorhabditis bacteriophora TaxID=37862 RepID=A0A1I7W9Z1_HETBA